MSEGVIKTEMIDEPKVCPKCKGALTEGTGLFGERVLICKEHKIIWGDAEQADILTGAAENCMRMLPNHL